MDDEDLIEIVRDFPLLYDTRHPDYTRTKLKDRTWNNIGAEYGSDGKTVKEQWRKLRERHREALRRQRIRNNGAKGDFQRPWLHQLQMDFLLPFMKHKSNEEDTAHNDQDEPKVGKCEELKKFQPDDSESPVPKRCKLSNQAAMRRLKQTSEMRANSRNELRETHLQSEQSSPETAPNDALFQFFMSMYNITKSLSGNYQRQVRNKIYDAVSQAEEENDLEITRKSSFTPSFMDGTASSSSDSLMIEQETKHITWSPL